MLQVNNPRDYVIASGRTHSLREFVNTAFRHARVEPQDRLETNQVLIRPSDLNYSALDPYKIERDLGWKAELDLEAIVARMMENLVL